MSAGTWLPGSDIAFLPTLQIFCHEMATGRLGEMTQSAELLSCKCKEHLDSEHMPAMIICLESQYWEYWGGRDRRILITS